MEMSRHVMDEGNIRQLAPRERLDSCISILKNSNDESMRWDAVWLAGEIAETSDPNSPIFDEISDLMCWVLDNDNNGVVKHEAAFQIAARNMRKKIPNLVNSCLHDKSPLVRHEALESLGLMRAFEAKELIMNALNDPNNAVIETAAFVLKRFARLENIGVEYKPYNIL